uniref:Uncharacterized protein n=1 Tax=Parascaris equorum TaxID=6256 RepID=A0A914S5W3_PAREQ
MQSRFALSGLSLCLITIILLWISVVTRRRRTMLAASHFERMANERLLREQQRRLCERRAVAIQVAINRVHFIVGGVEANVIDTAYFEESCSVRIQTLCASSTQCRYALGDRSMWPALTAVFKNG